MAERRGELKQLETVRALHQTVVSLRAALETSRTELEDLRIKYEAKAQQERLKRNDEGVDDALQNLSIENQELRRKLIDNNAKKVTFELDNNKETSHTTLCEETYTKEVLENNNIVEEYIKNEEITEETVDNKEILIVKDDRKGAVQNKEIIKGSEKISSFEKVKKRKKDKKNTEKYETTVELESKFDFTIKVCAVGEDGNVKPVFIKTTDSVHLTSDINSVNMDDQGQDNNANIKVEISSEENLVVNRTSERDSVSQSDVNTLEADDISVKSVSEGDNSVFSENLGGGINSKRIQDHDCGNDSEELDDIELIFTTDDTKELSGFQENLVSITDAENWSLEQNDPSTPVLLKFRVIDPDSENAETADNFENENQENYHTDPNKPTTRRGLLKSSGSKNYLETGESRQQSRKSFESNESFSFDNQKSFSFDNTKSSSFDRGSSVDAESRELSFDQRDESVDQFDVLRTTMRTQYSVCVETDISKCGVMDSEEFQGNLNIRRNTCPNPFQYRPLPHREVVKGAVVRPVLTTSGLRGPRKSSAAQTDISALPDRWRSDTHLARKSLPLALTTLPSKLPTKLETGSRLAPPKPMRPSRRTEEARRVLLSDIGFTSMVPELSRSAEPVWGALDIGSVVSSALTGVLPPVCCAQHASPGFGSVPSSPTRQDSRYWSRSSMQRSSSGKMADGTTGSHRVSFIDRPMRCDWRGSLPELRGVLHCCGSSSRHSKSGKSQGFTKSSLAHVGDSEDSTDELLDEADRFLRSSIDCIVHGRTPEDEFCPTRINRPYLPTGPQQLRLGHLVKVITPPGRIAVGKVRYVGIAGGPSATPVTYVGVQTGPQGVAGGGDGSFKGRRYFHCDAGKSIFVPFSKVVMAWST